MLLNVMAQYLKKIEIAVHGLATAYVERYEEEILSDNRVNLRIRIRFSNGNLLELNEAIIGEAGYIKHLNYRYHLQDNQNNLIFRYDNAPHFPELENFPHHKHLPEKVVSGKQASIIEVVEEANKLV